MTFDPRRDPQQDPSDHVQETDGSRMLGRRAFMAGVASLLLATGCSIDRTIEPGAGDGMATNYESLSPAEIAELAAQTEADIDPHTYSVLDWATRQSGRLPDESRADGVRRWLTTNAIRPGTTESAVAFVLELRPDEQRMTVTVFGTIGVDTGKVPTLTESSHQVVLEYLTGPQDEDTGVMDLFQQDTTHLETVRAERDTGSYQIEFLRPGKVSEAYLAQPDYANVQGAAIYEGTGKNRPTTTTQDRIDEVMPNITGTLTELGFEPLALPAGSRAWQ